MGDARDDWNDRHANLDTQPKLNCAPQDVTAVTGIGRLWAYRNVHSIVEENFAHRERANQNRAPICDQTSCDSGCGWIPSWRWEAIPSQD
jgi:hypothetical protein